MVSSDIADQHVCGISFDSGSPIAAFLELRFRVTTVRNAQALERLELTDPTTELEAPVLLKSILQLIVDIVVDITATAFIEGIFACARKPPKNHTRDRITNA